MSSSCLSCQAVRLPPAGLHVQAGRQASQLAGEGVHLGPALPTPCSAHPPCALPPPLFPLAESAISTALPPTKHVQLVLIEQPDNSVVYALEYEEPGSKEARTATPGTGGTGGNGCASARSSDVASSASAGSPAWAEEPEAQQQAADGQRQVLGSRGSSSTSAAAAGAWGYRSSQSPPPPG